MTGNRFTPGQIVLESGIYMMVSPTGRALNAPRSQFAGNPFSPTLYKGCKYRLQTAVAMKPKPKKKRPTACPKCGAQL